MYQVGGRKMNRSSQEILSWKHVAKLNEWNVWNYLWNNKYELVLVALADDKKNNEIS